MKKSPHVDDLITIVKEALREVRRAATWEPETSTYVLGDRAIPARTMDNFRSEVVWRAHFYVMAGEGERLLGSGQAARRKVAVPLTGSAHDRCRLAVLLAWNISPTREELGLPMLTHEEEPERQRDGGELALG